MAGPKLTEFDDYTLAVWETDHLHQPYWWTLTHNKLLIEIGGPADDQMHIQDQVRRAKRLLPNIARKTDHG